MSKHDESRRKFLVGAAVGAVAGKALVGEAVAQPMAHGPAGGAQAGQATEHMHGPGAGHGAFFNDDNAATIAAFAERLMPGAPGKPGATDAGVLNYIDLALAGAYADQQDFYRRGLAQLDAYCQKTFTKPFRELSAAQQDEVIGALAAGKATEFAWPSAQAFFGRVRVHTIEGMFADPVYGGNKDFAGWRLIGFPGAQPYFTPEEMQSREAFSRSPMLGLQAQAAGTSKGGR
jgi:gluconate 2-dehydrogenase gamma chain